jgi:serine/threonine protein kinase
MGKNLIDERYDLRDLVGSGGMANVFLAHDEVLDRDIALKLLKDRYAEDEEFVERFRREARSAAALTSPYIVPIFDRGETEDGTYYIAMEYLPGGTLKDRIRNTETLPPRSAAEVALQTAEALHTAHQRGVIHRDVKPDNILFTDSEHVKVVDFGIARAAEATTISHPGDILGSVKYMSPEQAAGELIGPASDLYSLGVILYEMLTGAVPFAVDIPADVPVKHAEEPPPHPREVNPEVPEDLDAIVIRLLAKDPNNRYGSAAELIEELRRVRNGLPPVTPSPDEATTAASATPSAPTLPQPAPGGIGPRRRRLPQILTALTALVAVLGVVSWFLLPNSGADSISQILKGVLGGPSDGAGQKLPSPQDIKVPDVEGLTEQEARERLAEAGFKTEIRRQEGSEEDAGRVLKQSVPSGKKVGKGSMILLTVGEGSQVVRVPDLIGLSYPEAESKLEESGFLLGGVKESPSKTVPAGMIMKQDPPPGTTLDPDAYVYLTTSVGPTERISAGEDQVPSATDGRYDLSGKVSSEEAAVAAAVRGHYEVIGAGNLEEAYSYFGPTFRSQHDQASWIAGEQSYQIQSSTINSLEVNEILGSTATATVDVTFVDNTGTPRFLIVWSLVQEGGEWKLDSQVSAQRIDDGYTAAPGQAATPTASATAGLP